MRRFLSGVLVFAMALISVTVSDVPVAAQDMSAIEKEYSETTYISADGLYGYTLNEDGTATITECKVKDTEVLEFPAVIDGYKVTKIGGKIGMYQYEYTTVVIPEGVTHIGESLFFGASSIKNISIPSSVISIGRAAFCRTHEDRVITVATGNLAYKVENNALLTIDGKEMLAFSGLGDVTSYTVPNGVVKICDSAIQSALSLDELVIPDSVVEIGASAVEGCGISNLVIGNNVEKIGTNAFKMNKLTSVTVPDSVKTIENSAFGYNDIENFVFGSGVETVGEFALASNPIKSLMIPASVTNIGEAVTAYCDSLEQITVDAANKSYKIINGSLFTMDGTRLIAYTAGSAATSYTIPKGATTLGRLSFSCAHNLEEIIFPDTLVTLNNAVFFECTGLKEYIVPDSVTNMGDEVFSKCTELELVSLSSGCKTIDDYTFKNCTSLKSIFIPSNVCNIYNYVFNNCTALADVYYVGSEEDWKNVYVSKYGNDGLLNANIHYLGNLKDFVSRLYTVALGRDFDSAGLNRWVRHLVAETHDGAGLAKEFVLGDEFALRNLSDEQYVDTLYTTFFNREADASGKELWIATLSSGQSREYVLSQFVNSDEFTLLCLDYGINRGVMFTNGTVAAPGLPQFVIRLYGQVLGRAAEKDGLYNWSEALVTKAVTAEEAAVNFFMSQEYALKNVDSTTFVTDCYSVFMDREADEAGLAFWVACLDEQGVSRQWVISEFAKSAEFKIIAAKYGL